MNIVKMEAGSFAWEIAGILYELDKWEAYDFFHQQWVPAKELWMFRANPFPYPNGASFLDMVKGHAEHLPPETTVYVYESNECFGALKPNGRTTLA